METTKSSDLRHSININDKTANCKIDIRLNDECKNGHEDFSITASFWTIGAVRSDRNFESGGCCHDEILKIRPDLAIFVKLHLNQFNGYPMHYFGNGFYHLKNMEKSKFLEYLLVDEADYHKLLFADTEDEFAYLMIQIGNHTKWENLAKEGIALMEKLTEKKFESKATRAFDIEKYKALEFPDDWFLPHNVQARKNQKIADKKAKAKKELIETSEKDIAKIKLSLNIKMQFLKMGYIKWDNVIIYEHTKTVTLNWSDPQYSTYNHKFTQEEYEKISKKLKLPEGWTVKLKQIY